MPHRVPVGEKQAKLKVWQDAYNEMKANYEAYRNLPEEADT